MKAVEELTDDERVALFPIVLSEYNPEWAVWFDEEKVRIEQLLNMEDIAGITHYGSTSVPGLMAKPTIDFLLEINENADIEKFIASFPPSEYICLRQSSTPNSQTPHLMFLKGYTPTGFAERVFHIHVRYPGDWDELYFRDFLIKHPDTAAEYAALKRKLKEQYEHDRDGYTEAKGGFIREVSARARKEV